MYKYNLVNVESNISNVKTGGKIKSFVNDVVVLELNDDYNFVIGESLDIEIFDKLNGYCVYTGSVREFSKNFITLHHVVLTNTLQRRKSKRIEISGPTNVVKSVIINKKKLLQPNKEIFMKAKDISSSGILLESPLDISVDTNFLVNLQIDNTSITLKTTTARKYTENNLFYYGCTFSLTSIEEQNFLLRFINKRLLSTLANDNSDITFYYV